MSSMFKSTQKGFLLYFLHVVHCDDSHCCSPMNQRRGTDHSSRLLLCLPLQTNAASALRGSTTVLCSAGYFRFCTETRRSRSTTAWSLKSTCFWTEKGWVTDISRSRIPQITALKKGRRLKSRHFIRGSAANAWRVPLGLWSWLYRFLLPTPTSRQSTPFFLFIRPTG